MVTETHRCPICHKLFFAKANARFCSGKCRKRASRSGVSASGNINQTIYDVLRKGLYELAGLGAQNTIKAITVLGLELLNDHNKKKIWEMLRYYSFEE